MFSFFKPRNSKIVAPVTGECIKMEEVADPAFSSKALGDGFAIKPTDGTVLSPVSGKVAAAASTLHAFAFITDDGKEVLLHIGLDTVKLGGEGFVCHVKKGAHVRAGERIAQFDLETMKLLGIDTTTIVAFTDGECIKVPGEKFGSRVVAGESMLSLG